MELEQPSLLDATNRMVVVAPPVVVEGLRTLGCDVAATTGFLVQLPQLVLRFAPDTVVVHADPRMEDPLVDALRRVRERTRLTRIVVLISTPCALSLQRRLDEFQCDTVSLDCEAAVLRDLLGVSPPSPVIALTAREVAVLRLAAEGLTNRGIGSRLGLSQNTVKNYLRRVHEKLDVHCRQEAILAAERAGYPVLPRR